MKVSLITATFNSEKTLADTIESVLNQDYKDLEYIIVDGESNDNTINIIKQYEAKFNGNFHWITEKDSGLYEAINKGINLASGDIIGIINSDDYYENNNIISKVVNCFESKPYLDAVYGNVTIVDAVNKNKEVRYYSSKFFSNKLFRLGFMPAHPTFFTYKNSFIKCGIYKTDYKIAGDFEMLARLLHKHKIKTEYMNLDMIRMRRGGISSPSLTNMLTINREIRRACKENNIKTCYPLLFLRYFYKIFEFIIK